MMKPNFREALYFWLYGLRGLRLGAYYRRMLREDNHGIAPDTASRGLARLLEHCQAQVPYYTEVMRATGGSFVEDPEAYLARLPLLTKDIIRARFEDLKSRDLPRRKWHFNTSGGSTGEPVRFIQDREYEARSGAIKLLFAKLIGREVGEADFLLWGSNRDLDQTRENRRAALMLSLSNTTILDAWAMTPERMREYINLLNSVRPKLITAYADAIYQLAKFAEDEGLSVRPQVAIVTSASTLYPFMRERIERVFQCQVYNRYGSREVGDIACERPGRRGLWVAPWGNYVEIVDSDGNRVPDGCEGDVLVTSLTNFAMPLIRYQIGDRGVLAPSHRITGSQSSQVIADIVGGTLEMFTCKTGQLIHASYFLYLLFFRDWIRKYRVIQKSSSKIVYRLVTAGPDHPQAELNELAAKTKLVMGDDCEVDFEFVNDISASGSGKYRYFICEVQA